MASEGHIGQQFKRIAPGIHQSDQHEIEKAESYGGSTRPEWHLYEHDGTGNRTNYLNTFGSLWEAKEATEQLVKRRQDGED